MQKKINRRDVLKHIVQSGSALAAAGLLPEKWSKPAVEGGYLPVHAGISSRYKMDAYFTTSLNTNPAGNYLISEPVTLEVVVTESGLEIEGGVDVTVWVELQDGSDTPNLILPAGHTGSDGEVQFGVSPGDIPYSVGVPFRISCTVASPVVLTYNLPGIYQTI